MVDGRKRYRVKAYADASRPLFMRPQAGTTQAARNRSKWLISLGNLSTSEQVPLLPTQFSSMCPVTSFAGAMRASENQTLKQGVAGRFVRGPDTRLS